MCVSLIVFFCVVLVKKQSKPATCCADLSADAALIVALFEVSDVVSVLVVMQQILRELRNAESVFLLRDMDVPQEHCRNFRYRTPRTLIETISYIEFVLFLHSR